MEKILPCPFCGAEAEKITLNEEHEVPKSSSWYNGDVIQCTKCFCSSRIFFGEKEGIIEAWNQRVKQKI